VGEADLADLQRHRWLLESVKGRVPIGPNWLAWVESALRALSGTGLHAKEMLAVILLVDGDVRSTAQISLGVTGMGEWADNFGRVLETVTGDERYPSLTALVAAGGFDARADGAEDTFEFGLERLLDGVEALVRARAPAPRPSRSVRRARRVRPSRPG
jgi:hypothetical protein